jgi:hypothetical protein
MQQEMTYRHTMKSSGWKDFNDAIQYLERYGEAHWEKH